MTRRESLREIFFWTARLGVIAPVALGGWGCRSEPPCTDLSMLSTPDRLRRTSVKYTSVSPKGEAESCRGCKFFRRGDTGPCGTCTLVPGPIAPGGRCDSWARA